MMAAPKSTDRMSAITSASQSGSARMASQIFATSEAALTVHMKYNLPSCSSGGESMSACSASSIALLYFRCKGTMTRSVHPLFRFREMTQTPRWAVDKAEPGKRQAATVSPDGRGC